jgi:hypothetical protein
MLRHYIGVRFAKTKAEALKRYMQFLRLMDENN